MKKDMIEKAVNETDLLASEEDIFQLVTFFLGEEVYGIDILAVQEIIRMQVITEIPRTADYVEGVINLRGKVIPVIDLRKRFNLPVQEETKDTRIIVVEIESKIMGMIVDGVSKVLRLPASLVEPPSPIVGGIDSNYIKGVGKVQEMLVILLDLTKINDTNVSLVGS
ncbi:MAG: chemotaxis protein CheW [Candidatus Margulisbacteria bacterium]|nr:chemotaxis protein CheW [Candidatus Margulisiibacteriota bacterium]